MKFRLNGTVCRYLVAVCLSMFGLQAQAGCPLKLQLTFSDGSRGCVDDYPLAAVKPQGFLVGAAQAIPQHGYFHLAAPRNPLQCPQALAISFAVGTNLSPQGAADGPRAHVREKEAQANCQRVAGDATPGTACECITIVGDGRVPIPRTEFERISTELGAVK